MPNRFIELLPPLTTLFKCNELNYLTGKKGTNRENKKCIQIQARNDYEAIFCWLAEYKYKNTTYQSYLKEAERLLLWCVVQQQKPLSSLDRKDFAAYIAFLADPQPTKLWCGPKGGKANPRGSLHWRPFVAGLSKSAQATSITIINSLMNYLVEARYLQFNPLSLMRKRLKINNHIQDKVKVYQRILEHDEWEAIIATVKTMPEETPHQRDAKERLWFILSLLFLLGLRINELVTHTWSAFRKIRGQWWFLVRGKSDKEGKIPVNDSLIVAVEHYRQHLGLSVHPLPEEAAPLIASWKTGQGIGARYVNKLLKNIALKAAKQFINQPEKMEKLRKFSAHWVRHLSATYQDEQGIAFKYIKENHRHESDDTTRRYVHTREKERHEQMQKLQLIFERKKTN